MKTIEDKTKSTQKDSHNHGKEKYPELKTDMPLSEKDEVKNAETRARKELKHHL
ncbi:MAG: hypothetical protein ACXVAY_13685 [Mucilaginibacter sp.]